MIKISIDSCTGCLACVQACPISCISAEISEEGFIYPKINSDVCINCRKCEKVCPLDVPSTPSEKPSAYAAVSHHDDVRTSSSSGGVFSLIAEKIISEGGIVFGAAFDSDFSVVHQYTDNVSDIQKFRGSKYLQSNIGNTFKEAKVFLDNGTTVLFSGTPCQIAGLRSFLGRKYENLICQDIICHSIPSPAVWKHYLFLLTKGEKPIAVSFRNKENGWEDYTLAIDTESEKVRSPGRTDPYIRAFISGLISRKSCFDCRFKDGKSKRDITLADCWGVKSFAPAAYDKNGVSLVFLNTEKGKKLFESVSEQCSFTPVDYQAATDKNPAALYPSNCHRNRKKFMSGYKKLKTADDFAELYRKCAKISLYNKSVMTASRIVGKITKIILKNKEH